MMHPSGATDLRCVSPAQYSAQEGGVEALRWGQSSFDLRNGHFVLGRGAEERQSSRDGAEQICRIDHAGPPWTHTHTHTSFFIFFKKINQKETDFGFENARNELL